MFDLVNKKVVEKKRLNARNARAIAATPQKLANLYEQIRKAAEEGEPCLTVKEIRNWHVHNALSHDDGYDVTDVPGKNQTVIWWGYE